MTTLQGHNSKINSLAWSKDERLLISASADKSCIVWNMMQGKKGEKLLVLDRLVKTKQGQQVAKTKAEAAAQSSNPPFDDQIRQAQFYHGDSMIVLASGGSLNFYKYELPNQSESTTDDVKRLQQRGLYRLMQTFKHPSAHTISSFSLHNALSWSHIGIMAGSNKELIVFDVDRNMPVTSAPDTHFKHAHTVKFYEGAYA